jgi:hypothetical protein
MSVTDPDPEREAPMGNSQKGGSTQDLLVSGDRGKLDGLFSVSSTTCRASTIEILLDVMPAEATNLSKIQRVRKRYGYQRKVGEGKGGGTGRERERVGGQPSLLKHYLVATRARTKVSIRDIKLLHAEGAVEIIFVRVHCWRWE